MKRRSQKSKPAVRRRRPLRATRAVRRGAVIPAVMQAAAMERFGTPEVLDLETLPTPKPGPNQVLIALDAAGIGSWDIAMRDGSWWPGKKPSFPVVLGSDGAGTIVAKGARARRFDIGDRVWTYAFSSLGRGTYAEYIAVDAEEVGPVPAGLDRIQAGAAPATGLTALQGVRHVLDLEEGETVLIIGASGGVGSLALQLAKGEGAHVVAAVHGADAGRLVKRLGADMVIDTSKGQVAERLERLVPDGLDAILAFAWSDEYADCMDLLRPGGRLAFPNGLEPVPPKRLRVRVESYDAEGGTENLVELAQAFEEYGVRVPLAATMPLAQAAKAHARVEKGHVLGRVALRIR